MAFILLPVVKFSTGYSKHLVNVSYQQQHYYDDDCKDGGLFFEKENTKHSKDERVPEDAYHIMEMRRFTGRKLAVGKGPIPPLQEVQVGCTVQEHLPKLPIPILMSMNQMFIKQPENPSVNMDTNVGSGVHCLSPNPCSVIESLCNLGKFPKHSVPSFFHV